MTAKSSAFPIRNGHQTVLRMKGFICEGRNSLCARAGQKKNTINPSINKIALVRKGGKWMRDSFSDAFWVMGNYFSGFQLVITSS